MVYFLLTTMLRGAGHYGKNGKEKRFFPRRLEQFVMFGLSFLLLILPEVYTLRSSPI